MEKSLSETKRLEALWEGEFGDAYTERNRAAGKERGQFWDEVLDEFPARRIIEIGCNLGANLQWIASRNPPQLLYGVDINLSALRELRSSLPEVNTVFSAARELPFRDRYFDMVFTMGVLIHQPSDALSVVMAEIVRCSNQYVVCGEYFAAEPTEVPYRGQKGALFKRDFGGLYQRLFPELKLRKQGFLSRSQGWDDVTYWVFERSKP